MRNPWTQSLASYWVFLVVAVQLFNTSRYNYTHHALALEEKVMETSAHQRMEGKASVVTKSDKNPQLLEEDCVVQEDGTVICSVVKTEGLPKKSSNDNDKEDHSPEGKKKETRDVIHDNIDDDDDDDVREEENSTENASPPPKEAGDCKDNHELCSFWASGGECTINPRYMLNNCKRSCNNCADDQVDLKISAEKRRRMEEQTLLDLVANYGEPQKAEGNEKDHTLLVVRKTIDYMRNFIHAENPTHRLPQEIIQQCTNNHELCSFWAAIGECQNNISFMQTKCAPACQSCTSIDYDNRCPQRPKDEPPALLPGQLNQMFERIVASAPGNRTDETLQFAQERRLQEDGMTPYYTVTIHSRPQQQHSTTVRSDMKDEVDEKARNLENSSSSTTATTNKEKDLNDSPWVVTFDNFLTDEECDYFIQLGHKAGYERSKDVGEKTVDGSYTAKISATRTSENAWCSVKNGCRNDPIATRVRDRISRVLQIPTQNFEDFQLLRYEEGQFYVTHHDYIPHQKDRACGPRILTFYLYLSDVEEGGGTALDQINDGLVIQPKKGRALLWPSVLNYDPNEKDGRTTHQALPVGKGIKYGANTWVHLYDVIETHRRGCT